MELASTTYKEEKQKIELYSNFHIPSGIGEERWKGKIHNQDGSIITHHIASKLHTAQLLPVPRARMQQRSGFSNCFISHIPYSSLSIFNWGTLWNTERIPSYSCATVIYPQWRCCRESYQKQDKLFCFGCLTSNFLHDTIMNNYPVHFKPHK